MPKYTVNVDEVMLRNGRQRLTAGQWLAQCRVYNKSEGRLLVFDLPEPITISAVKNDGEKPETKICRKSWQILEMFCRGHLVAVRWRSGYLGPRGLHTLNTALNTAAVRKGGLNIVRHWLENRTGGGGFLREDFFALLSFLEIRPVFRVKTAKPTTPKTIKTPAS